MGDRSKQVQTPVVVLRGAYNKIPGFFSYGHLKLS